MEDRLEQAKRMGWLCDQIVKVGNFVITDFFVQPKQGKFFVRMGSFYYLGK